VLQLSRLKIVKKIRKKKEPAMSMETKKEKEPATNVEATQTNMFTRQPLSVFGKIAFWTSVVGALGGIAGTIILTIFTGFNLDIIIMTVSWLASAGILATRYRWAPLVSTLLGGSLLYQLYTQPYVFESLSSPKGPNGGFGKFVGEVLFMVSAFLVFSSSIGAAAQNYREKSRQDQRWLPAVLGLVAGMIIGALFIGAISQPPTATGTTYTNGVPTVHMGAGSFLQSSVIIPKGSKLLLVDDVAALHILVNGSWQNGAPKPVHEPGAPTVNNLQVNGNSVEIGPFATAGTYHIFCTVHQGMNLTVVVQ
jgi:hypothetical protein